MSWRERIEARRLRRRHSRDEDAQRPQLREFVYLDDVSVYSLRASQVGLIVTELTEAQASSLQSEVRSSAGINVGLGKGDVGSAFQSEQTQESHVLRKAVIQTTFKEMYEASESSLAFASPPSNASPPVIESIDSIRQLAKDPSQAWVVDPSRLRRGDLVDFEVQLEAEQIYQAGAIVAAVHEIVKDDPTVFGVTDVGQLGEIRVVGRLMEKLLAGLVPVRGRLLHYDVVEVAGEEFLVHTSLRVDPEVLSLEIRNPFIVGVAEKGLFWKDVRRVLFSGATYRVLGRLARDGLQPSWTPIKLVAVMRDVIPEFAEIMDAMNRGVLSAMSTAVAAQHVDPNQDRAEQALLAFAELLLERTSNAPTRADVQAAGLLSPPNPVGELTIARWRTLFLPIIKFVEDGAGTEIDPSVASECRVAALAHAGLLPGATAQAMGFQSDRRDVNERFLDVEIVAVYW